MIGFIAEGYIVYGYLRKLPYLCSCTGPGYWTDEPLDAMVLVDETVAESLCEMFEGCYVKKVSDEV